MGFAIISGCGKSVSEIKDSNLVENDMLEGDITFSTEETSGDSNEGFVQMSADELLDRFVNGEVSAHCLYDTAKTFYITELDMDIVVRRKSDGVSFVLEIGKILIMMEKRN